MSAVGFTNNEMKKMELRLELTEPSEKDGVFELSATAIVTNVDGRPVANVEIQFYRNGKADSPQHTEGDGRATKEFTDLPSGSHTFEVVIVGTTTKCRRVKKLKIEKPKRATKIEMTRGGERENRWFIFQVLTEDNQPVSNATVRVTDEDLLKEFVDVKTNSQGVTPKVDLKISQARGEKVSSVRVLGTNVHEWFNLFFVPGH